jgi:hypothetical protein
VLANDANARVVIAQALARMAEGSWRRMVEECARQQLQLWIVARGSALPLLQPHARPCMHQRPWLAEPLTML